MTREQLAVDADVSWTTIRAHELGLVNGFEAKTAEALATALKVEVQDLFFDRNTQSSVKNGSDCRKESA